MESDRMDLLLNKYFEGETSLGDEKALRDYFESDKVAEPHLSYKPLFLLQNEESMVGLDDSFDEKIDALLRKNNAKRGHVRSLQTRLLRVAAVGVLVLGMGFLIFQFMSNRSNSGMLAGKTEVIQSEQEAYEQVKMALLLVSTKMNEGMSQTKSKLDLVDSATKIFK